MYTGVGALVVAKVGEFVGSGEGLMVGNEVGAPVENNEGEAELTGSFSTARLRKAAALKRWLVGGDLAMGNKLVGIVLGDDVGILVDDIVEIALGDDVAEWVGDIVEIALGDDVAEWVNDIVEIALGDDVVVWVDDIVEIELGGDVAGETVAVELMVGNEVGINEEAEEVGIIVVTVLVGEDVGNEVGCEVGAGVGEAPTRTVSTRI
mmetsp:Transcript_31874/g.45876  ORF Transcript_31874/g.45876 Transcript_31874/m.45876 type:complete len:207 (+) Transcript_31874:1533-2153(+)